MEIRIGSIFKNEYDYVLEWLAWHRLAGFKKFIVADNGSNDKTLQLLEALSSKEITEVMYQPKLQGNSQLTAYRRISERFVSDQNAILFLDADEFLVHDSFEDGSEYLELEGLISKPDVGMVGINWRCFGSSGLEKKDGRPVLERFNHCSNDEMHGKNCHLKSATKLAFAYQIGPHISYLYPPYKRVDTTGDPLTDFIEIEAGVVKPATNMPKGIAKHVVEGPLRVNHYVIKSKEEFTLKKLNRGDAMGGELTLKDSSYFDIHDFKDIFYQLPETKITSLKNEIKLLEEIVGSSIFNEKLIGAVDKSNEKFISGWVCRQDGESCDIQLSVFVNGIFQGRANARYFRPDLKDKNISKDGMCGFYFHHESTLKQGDEVEVKVFGNTCGLMGCRTSVIDK
ncbi:glycosyl transferase family 2 [Pseudomonas sp. URIL14HWK12:I3]|uniref:glycosyltransferase family 2 protein n=1 Tax=Pseudomonas TaxID=286 RepID=UPI000DAD78DD|nr:MULTISPECIES: glycosyltransferase family 2 protein [Pseudomonas]PZW48877.1 glycosyl transferase family 2 [Pseudomonas sp. URIL14HWK12:I2]PZW58383.1 glycosyl transferase family 2 [Pseudomonas sp. URIL14HWK12:I3]